MLPLNILTFTIHIYHICNYIYIHMIDLYISYIFIYIYTTYIYCIYTTYIYISYVYMYHIYMCVYIYIQYIYVFFFVAWEWDWRSWNFSEVVGRPYHPSVGSFAAFDSLQGEARRGRRFETPPDNGWIPTFPENGSSKCSWFDYKSLQ